VCGVCAVSGGCVHIVPFAEREPEFAANVIKALGKDAKIIVACDIGGTLKTVIKSSSGKDFADPDRAFGRESRCVLPPWSTLQPL
jgi:hypothetical protein